METCAAAILAPALERQCTRLVDRVLLSSDSKAALAYDDMNTPEHFEVNESYCCYRLSGHGSLADAASKVVEIIAFSRAHEVRNLLIDTTQWTGHNSPATMERYQFALAFAEAANSEVKLAMVVRPEMMDPEKFEVTVATNRGLEGNVFDSETEALAWLLAPVVSGGLTRHSNVAKRDGDALEV